MSQIWWISSPGCCDLWPRRCRGWWLSAGEGRAGTDQGSRETGRDSCWTSPWSNQQSHIKSPVLQVKCACSCSDMRGQKTGTWLYLGQNAHPVVRFRLSVCKHTVRVCVCVCVPFRCGRALAVGPEGRTAAWCVCWLPLKVRFHKYYWLYKHMIIRTSGLHETLVIAV